MRCRRSCAVTLGYSLSCLDMSLGNASILCCHGLPPSWSSCLRRRAYLRRCTKGRSGGRNDGLAICRQWRDGLVKSCRNMRVTNGESIQVEVAREGRPSFGKETHSLEGQSVRDLMSALQGLQWLRRSSATYTSSKKPRLRCGEVDTIRFGNGSNLLLPRH